MAELKRVNLIFLFCFLLVLGGRVAAAGDEQQWSIRINIPASTLELLRNGKVWRQFPVAVGKKSTPTPVGRFTIDVIIEDPTWYPTGRSPIPPGVENPLGRYWLGLSLKGYGIHGNNNPSSIGNPESNGCIRMHNHDVELLVGLVRVGTPVEIVYQTAKVEVVGDRIWLTLFPDYYQWQNNQQEAVKKAMNERVLPYRVHWEALWWLLPDNRPQVLEVPQEIQVMLDGEAYPQAGFVWGDRAFLPATLTGLWGEVGPEPYLEMVEFMRTCAGQVYGIFDQQAALINLHTLRIYYNGRLFPRRGWFREEPYLPRELTSLLEQDFGPPRPSAPLGTETEQDDRWVPLSAIVACWPEMEVRFDAQQWVLTIGH